MKPSVLIALAVVGGVVAATAGLYLGKGSGSGPDPAQGHSLTKTLDGRSIDGSGTYEFPNSVGHPGNPEEAVEDFKRLYRAIDSFRKSTGKMVGAAELLDPATRMANHLDILASDLQNPDWKHAENPSALRGDPQPNSPYALNFLSNRPDGTPKPAFPEAGERDV